MKIESLTKILLNITVTLVLILSSANVVLANEDVQSGNTLSLVALLIKDGHFERAKNVLAKADNDEKRDEPGRYELLEGLLYLAESQYQNASQKLEVAKEIFSRDVEKNQEKIEELRTYLAQAYFAQEKYGRVLSELAQVKRLKEQRPKIYLLEANSLWKLGQTQKAIELVSKLTQQFPANSDFNRLYHAYLVELNLYQVALESILKDPLFLQYSASEQISLANIFMSVARYREARLILEAARLSKTHNEYITKELASIYVREKSYFAAATLFDELALIDLKYAEQASELYRLAGYPVRALTFNGMVANRKSKLKQRLALYIEEQDFERATTLENSLTLDGLLEQEEIRYALAYAFYKVRNFQKTQIHLSLIGDEKLFEKATNLRASIEKCQENIWACE